MVNNLEAKLWFYYIAKSFIDIGIEAFHLGQVELIGRDDPDEPLIDLFDDDPPLANLPQTGQLLWPIPALSGFGLIISCTGVAFIKKHGKEE